MVKEFTKTLMILKNKNETTALAGWLSCLEHCPVKSLQQGT